MMRLGYSVKRAQLLIIKAQVLTIWAKGCMLMFVYVLSDLTWEKDIVYYYNYYYKIRRKRLVVNLILFRVLILNNKMITEHVIYYCFYDNIRSNCNALNAVD